MSAIGLHLFTAVTAYGLVAPGSWRWVAAVAAWVFPAIAEAVVAFGAWRSSGSMVNAYSVWVLAWLLFFFILLGLVPIFRRLGEH